MVGEGARSELADRLGQLESRIAAEVHLSGNDSTADHPLRGLYLSHDRALGLLAEHDASGRDKDSPTAGAARPPLGPRLAAIAARASLDDLDIDILVCALAPDVDPRHERLYGYLHDDMTMRRATVGLAMRLCGLSPFSADRRRFDASSALRMNALLTVEDDERPFLGRVLRVPDHVVTALLGGPDPEPLLSRFVIQPIPLESAEIPLVSSAIRRSVMIHLTEGIGGAAAHVAAMAAEATGVGSLIVDVTSAGAVEMEAVLAAAIRHHALTGDVLVIRPVEFVAEHARWRLAQLGSLHTSAVLIGTANWDPSWTVDTPHHIAIPDLADAEIERVWNRSLEHIIVEADAVARVRRSFRLTPEQITRTSRAASLAAEGSARPISFGDLSSQARTHSRSGLDRLARRLEARAGWDDLVLPGQVMVLLNELALRVRWREQVMQDWGLGGGWRGRGIAALFAGPSGTGKTTAAEVIAGDLGYDIHVVDLSSVVDKYIGETEKKLEVIFSEAERSNTVLLFDEADAIFGKRSEVKDARDRYANIEVSYLLQRIERFSGLAILTTNLGANLDEAFTRRLDVVVDFPRPDTDAREQIWRHELRPTVPVADIDFGFCAAAFDVTGGNIRNIVVAAAYLAAETGTAITMRHVVTAVQREYRKMGRLCVPSEFGPYSALLQPAHDRE